MKKTLLTAILTVAMCLSLTIGATFAFFTSESEVNVAVSSANVEIKAAISDLDVDMYAGTASKNGGEVSIERMLPGDSVSFAITVENYSNVPVQYRTVISSEDSGLFSALKITLNDKVYGGGYVYEDWAEISPSDTNADTKDDIKVINVKVEFPELGVDQSAYKNTNCKFNVKVEAVQGNHQVVNPVTFNNGIYEINSEEGMMLMNGIVNSVSHGEGVELKFKLTDDMNMAGYNWTPVPALFVIIDGNGKTISNLNCGIDEWGRSGFMGYFGGSKIYNLTLENVTAKGSQSGLVAGSIEGAYFENVVIKGNNTVTYDYLANTKETWGGAGVIAAVGSYVNANSSVVIENGAKVVVNYNKLVTSAPYGCEYCLNSDVSAIVTNNGTVTVNGEYVKVISNSAEAVATLASATQGTFVIDCEFTMPSLQAGANIVIEGLSEKAIVNIRECSFAGGNVTFKNLIVNGIDISTNATVGEGGYFTHQLVGANKVTFDGCIINKNLTTYSSTDFIGCTFNNDIYEYAIWLYSGAEHLFDGCTFNSVGKMIKVFNQGAEMKVTVKNSTFNAAVEKKAAVELDCGFNKAYVYLENVVLGSNVTKTINDEPARLAKANVCLNGAWIVGSAPNN